MKNFSTFCIVNSFFFASFSLAFGSEEKKEDSLSFSCPALHSFVSTAKSDNVFDKEDYLAIRKEFLQANDQVASSEQVAMFLKKCTRSVTNTPFSLYGIPLAEFEDLSITCRTLIECMNDEKAAQLWQEQRSLLQSWVAQNPYPVVFDPFCGSGNTLFNYVAKLTAMGTPCQGVGWENNETIVRCTKHCLQRVGSNNLTIDCCSFEDLEFSYKRAQLVHPHILFLCPPWGDAVNEQGYLDLGKTHPPVKDIVQRWKVFSKDVPTLYIMQVTKNIVQESLEILCKSCNLEILVSSTGAIVLARHSDPKKATGVPNEILSA